MGVIVMSNTTELSFLYNSSVKPKVVEASLGRKSSDSLTHVKNVVKTRCFHFGLNPKKRQHQNSSDKNVTSVVKNSAQHNLSPPPPPPVVHPMALNSNGNTNVRDEQISGVEQTHVEVEQGIDSGQGLNLTMVKNSDYNGPSGPGLSPPNQNTKHIVNQQVASEWIWRTRLV